jgi:septal ring factor EnvC (AmiA/AmiB activator)
VARSIGAVLYGHVLHALKEKATEHLTHVVKAVDVHSHLDAFHACLHMQQIRVDALADNITSLSTHLNSLSRTLDILTASLSTFETRLAQIDTRLTEIATQISTVEQGQGSHITELERTLRLIAVEVQEETLRELSRQLSPLGEQIGTMSSKASLPAPCGQGEVISTRVETAKWAATFQETRQVRRGDGHNGQTHQRDTLGEVDSERDTEQRDSRKSITLSAGSGGGSRRRQSQAKVISYILDIMRRDQREPTLSEIMNATGCAKQTAVDSRKNARQTFQRDCQLNETPQADR